MCRAWWHVADPLSNTSCALLKCLLFPDVVAVNWLVHYVIFPQWRTLSPASSSTALVLTMQGPHPHTLLCGQHDAVLAGLKGGLHSLPACAEGPLVGLGSRDLCPRTGAGLGQPESSRLHHHPPAPVFPDCLLATSHPHLLFGW